MLAASFGCLPPASRYLALIGDRGQSLPEPSFGSRPSRSANKKWFGPDFLRPARGRAILNPRPSAKSSKTNPVTSATRPCGKLGPGRRNQILRLALQSSPAPTAGDGTLRHREAPSGAVAISTSRSLGRRDCFASLAMTGRGCRSPALFLFHCVGPDRPYCRCFSVAWFASLHREPVAASGDDTLRTTFFDIGTGQAGSRAFRRCGSRCQPEPSDACCRPVAMRGPLGDVSGYFSSSDRASASPGSDIRADV
jgi:hypothetical protein